MCGLYGVILHKTPTTALQSKIAGLTNVLAVLSAERGTDATGVAQIWATGEVSYYKKAIPAYEIVRDSLWRSVVGQLYADSVAIMGHTRRKTVGENTEANAHPHIIANDKYGTLAGTHNGSVYNHTSLLRTTRTPHTNDSANLITALADLPDWKWSTPLYRASGSIALALSRNGHFYLTRNNDSPLVAALMEDGSFTAYASTEHILRSALVLSKLHKYEVYPIVANRLYQWQPHNIKARVTVCEYNNWSSGYGIGYGSNYVSPSCKLCGGKDQVIYVKIGDGRYMDQCFNCRNTTCDACGGAEDVTYISTGHGVMRTRCRVCRTKLLTPGGTSAYSIL